MHGACLTGVPFLNVRIPSFRDGIVVIVIVHVSAIMLALVGVDGTGSPAGVGHLVAPLSLVRSSRA
jgi:hypothetical protein